MKPPDALQRLVRRRMHELGISGREAARRCGIPASTWSLHVTQTRSGRNEVPHEHLEKISTHLGIPLAQLERAAIEAAGYHVDVRKFSPAEIFTVWSASDVPAAERQAVLQQLLDLTRRDVRSNDNELPVEGGSESADGATVDQQDQRE